METPTLLVNVWPITAARQNLHLLSLYAQADFDPLKTLCVQCGRTEHKGRPLVRSAQPSPKHWRIWPEVPSSLRISHLSEQKGFVDCQYQTKLYLRLVNSNVANLELADPSLDVGGCKGLHIAEENMWLGDSDLLFQRLHRRTSQGDISQSQPSHLSLNLRLQGYQGKDEASSLPLL